MPKVHLFPVIPGLHSETQLPTQRRSNGEPPANYRFTIDMLQAFFESEYRYVRIAGAAAYISDSAAASAGVSVGEFYELSAGNIYGMAAGLIKKRIE